MNSAIVIVVSRPGCSCVSVLLYISDLFPALMRPMSLRGLYRLDTSRIDNPSVKPLSSSERVLLQLTLSRSLQFMTLLPGIAFAFIVAFLVTAVALNIGLIGSLFVWLLLLFILVSFLITLVVGTWLAFSGIDLHPL
jgi:hypothetical protein